MNYWSGSCGIPALIRHAAEPPLIQVTGEGRLQMVPDTLRVSFGVTSRAVQAEDAFRQAAAVVSRIVQALQELGIRREQVQTRQIDLRPVYEENRLAGFEATGTLQITLPDPEAMGTAIDRAVAAGANQVHGNHLRSAGPSPL